MTGVCGPYNLGGSATATSSGHHGYCLRLHEEQKVANRMGARVMGQRLEVGFVSTRLKYVRRIQINGRDRSGEHI